MQRSVLELAKRGGVAAAETWRVDGDDLA